MSFLHGGTDGLEIGFGSLIHLVSVGGGPELPLKAQLGPLVQP